jgi:hypothetical protein
LPGAKSTQPKQGPTSSNANQQEQAEAYNRDMRRRMQHMKTGPYAADSKTQTMQDRRRKQVERRKERLDENRQQLRKALPGGKITLGRRNTYFLIGIIVLIVVLIVLFIVLRQLHVLG